MLLLQMEWEVLLPVQDDVAKELDEVFSQPWPAMASARKRKIAVREEGDVEVIQVRLILYGQVNVA